MGLGVKTRMTKAITTIRSGINDRGLSRLVFDGDRSFVHSARKELERDGFIAELRAKFLSGQQYVAGRKSHLDKPCTQGHMEESQGIFLYSLVRKYRPEQLVETGVCNGYSSAYILKALQTNGSGRLYSIDYPEIAGRTYPKGVFWEGKSGCAVPKTRRPGWVVPAYLRKNWRIQLGKSQKLLVPLLRRLRRIDFFLHDSEHSYECMWFEYRAAYKFLRPGSILVSDDIHYNSSFFDFARSIGKQVIRKGTRTGLIIV